MGGDVCVFKATMSAKIKPENVTLSNEKITKYSFVMTYFHACSKSQVPLIWSTKVKSSGKAKKSFMTRLSFQFN